MSPPCSQHLGSFNFASYWFITKLRFAVLLMLVPAVQPASAYTVTGCPVPFHISYVAHTPLKSARLSQSPLLLSCSFSFCSFVCLSACLPLWCPHSKMAFHSFNSPPLQKTSWCMACSLGEQTMAASVEGTSFLCFYPFSEESRPYPCRQASEQTSSGCFLRRYHPASFAASDKIRVI